MIPAILVRSGTLCVPALLLALITGCDRAEKEESDQTPGSADSPPESELVLSDSEGEERRPFAVDGRKATVLVFLMNDCPVANASAPALARVCTEFAPRGVVFYGVYTTESAEEVSAHRRDYSLPFPGLIDPGLKLAKRAGATRVPEAAVFSPFGDLLYRGRIDDRAVSLGVIRPQPRREDLRLALDSVLAGRKPETQFTTSVGCYLPFDLEESP